MGTIHRGAEGVDGPTILIARRDMDYDQTNMPAVYDAGRAYSPAVLTLWRDVISRWVPNAAVSDILDLGCGTGRYSTALAEYFDVRVTAVDPSEKMLAEARKKSTERVRYVRAAGESLPLPDACLDMVFISMVFHHFDDPDQVVRECHRVLRRDGTVCLRAGTTDRVGETPYLPFFARSRAILNTAFHSQAAIEAIFIDAGFQPVGHELIRHEVAGNWKAYADRLAFRADSILVQLSEQEFEGGLAALRRHAVTAPPDEPVTELVDFFVFRSG
jgi:ubiquinone/menaquinone biosynthesis C-methylase UbiE